MQRMKAMSPNIVSEILRFAQNDSGERLRMTVESPKQYQNSKLKNQNDKSKCKN
jgi:hypothetical protein